VDVVATRTLVIWCPAWNGNVRDFEVVVTALEAVTPLIELTDPGTCAFATRGPSRYFGGDKALVHEVVRRTQRALQTLGNPGPVRVGLADGPFAARVAAFREEALVTVVAPGSSATFLRGFSVHVLDNHELTEVLVRLGITTLGAFVDLDRSDVLGRFGREGEGAHRLASGLDNSQPLARRIPPDLEVVVELDPPVDRIDQAAFVAKGAADELHERLSRLGAVCTRVLVGFESEHGEVRERLWRHEGALSPTAISERVRWQLDGWLNGSPDSRPTGGLERLLLRPDEVGPAQGREVGFWGQQSLAAERAAGGVARVQGLLGPDAVLAPVRRGGRQPHDQLVLAPVAGFALAEGRTVAAVATDKPWPGQLPAPSPTVVYRRSLEAHVLDSHRHSVGVNARGVMSEVPKWLGVGTDPKIWFDVAAWAGPWPLDERWWDAESARRRARFQIVTNDGKARLMALAQQRWWVDGTYE